MERKKWIYKKVPLRDYINSIISNEDDAEFLYNTIMDVFNKEYHDGKEAESLMDDIFNRDKIKKIIKGEYKRRVRKVWLFNNTPLKEYLASLLEDKSELNYFYSTFRRTLEREYQDEIDMDALITDILSRDKFRKIIEGSYVKQEANTWIYKNIPLKKYLESIVTDPRDLEHLYGNVRKILSREYSDDIDLDELIDDVLNRENIKKIIDGDYTKVCEVSWFFCNVPLKQYISENIHSSYRDDKQIYKMITHWVSEKIKRNNLSVDKREELITEYLQSESFRKMIATPPMEKLEYFYDNQTLRQYLINNVVDKENVDYVYSLIISKILRIYRRDTKRNLDELVRDVMESEDISTLIKIPKIEKMSFEVWPYQNGLLVDYLRTIDLNGRDVMQVYRQVKRLIIGRNPEGFKSVDDKRVAIEEYICSDDFVNYLKYGYTNKVYFYEDMLLIDYLRNYYEEDLKRVGKTVDDLYLFITRILARYDLPEDLDIKEREQFIDDILRSDEIKIYLKKDKMTFEDWTYDDKDLKDVIREKYADVIEEEYDVIRIYYTIVDNCRKRKGKNPDMSNKEILSNFFTDETMKSFKESYVKRKRNRKEVKIKSNLFDNKDDYEYICLYALENNLDIEKIEEIAKKGFNYYAAIIMMEYASKEKQSLDEIILYSSEEKDDLIYLLWKFKLGYRDSIFSVLENQKRLVYFFIYQQITEIFGYRRDLKAEDIYNFLVDLLMRRFIIITCPIDKLYASLKSFIKSSIRRYLLELRRTEIKYNDVERDFIEPFISNVNIEDDYIENEEKEIINNAIDRLSDLESEFIDLRYGFTGRVHNLYEIKKIFEEKNIDKTVEELEIMQEDILNRLKESPDFEILSLDYKE